MKIAVVQSRDGHTTVCGPHEYREQDYPDAMNAAISWHLEAGHLPAAYYWVEVDLPPVPSIPEVRALAARGEFPKALIEELDGPVPDIPGVEEQAEKLPADWGSV